MAGTGKENTRDKSQYTNLEGCFLTLQFTLGFLAQVEEAIRHKSFIEQRVLGGSNLAKDIGFYSDTITQGDRERLPFEVAGYLKDRNYRADRYAMEDLPANVYQSFNELKADVGNLVANGEYRRAIETLYDWLNALRKAPEGKGWLTATWVGGPSSATQISFLLESPIEEQVSHIYQLIAEKHSELIPNPEAYYLKAANSLIHAELFNSFQSHSEFSAEKVASYLEKAGFQKEAEKIRAMSSQSSDV